MIANTTTLYHRSNDIEVTTIGHRAAFNIELYFELSLIPPASGHSEWCTQIFGIHILRRSILFSINQLSMVSL